MSRMIFVNLPVEDLGRATAFYEAIGAIREPPIQRRDGGVHGAVRHHPRDAADPPQFRAVHAKPIADAHATSEVLLCISEDSREGVDAITEKALATGGKEAREAQDFGFMYSRSFEDPDGHLWEPMWMDMAAAEAAMAPEAASA